MLKYFQSETKHEKDSGLFPPVAHCTKLNWSTNDNKAPVAAATKLEAQWRCNLLFVTRLQEKKD